MSGVLSSGSATVVAPGHSSGNLLIRVFDTLLVESGGTATATHVTGAGLVVVGGGNTDPGGSALVYGTIIDTLIDQEFVSNGQTYTGPGGIVTLGAGGVALATVISGGGLFIGSGASAGGVTDAGELVVSAGGHATNVTDKSDEQVAGGTVTDTTIDYGLFGGSQEITSGGLAIKTTIDGRDTVQTISSGTASDTTIVGAGSMQTVFAGGRAVVTTLASGTFATVSSGGATTSTTISKGAAELVLAGGSAVDTTVDSGGVLLLLGGSATGNDVLPGGTAISSGVVIVEDAIFLSTSGSGSTASTIVTTAFNGVVLSYFATVASGASVAQHKPVSTVDEAAYVLNSGETVKLNDESLAVVFFGGIASATQVSPDGSLVVSDGGLARATTITQVSGAAGSLTVLSGGIARFSTDDAGMISVAGGGHASATTLTGYTYLTSEVVNGQTLDYYASAIGTETVRSGGFADGATVDGFGLLQVYGDGDGIFVNSGGLDVVAHGGTTVGTQVGENGTEEVFGVANATSVGTYAREIVEAGGIANNTDLVAYGVVIVSGSAAHLVDPGGGEVSAVMGARVTDSTIGNGGEQEISSGAAATGTYLSGGTEVLVGGTATGTHTDGDGEEAIDAGGESVDDVLSGPHVIEYVFSGTALRTSVSAGAELVDDQGGSAVSAQVFGGGLIQVDGGVAMSTYIASSAVMGLYDPTGSALHTVVASGGYVSATGSGSFIDGTIDGGGKLYLIDDAVASGLIVLSGGVAIVDEGGSFESPQGLISGAQISSGATLEVLSANAFAGLTGVAVSKGGILEVGGFVVTSGQVVRTPGVQTVATVYSGVAVAAGGTIDTVNAVVSSGGELIVPNGAAAYEPEVQAGGTILIQPGGSAVNAFFDYNNIVTDNGAIVFDEPASGGNPYLRAPITGNGDIVFNGAGTLEIDSVNSFAGGITLDSGAAVLLEEVGGAGTGAIDMTGVATVDIAYSLPSNSFATAITGFGLGDAIALYSLGYEAGYTVSVSGNHVALRTPSAAFAFDIVGAAADTFKVAANPAGGTLLSAVAPSPPPTLAQALSASQVFQARADSAALFGSEGFGADAPVSVHLGGNATDLYVGGTSVPFVLPPVSAV